MDLTSHVDLTGKSTTQLRFLYDVAMITVEWAERGDHVKELIEGRKEADRIFAAICSQAVQEHQV